MIAWKQYEQIKQKEESNNSIICFPNPYEYEIDHYEYLPKQLNSRNPILYKSNEVTPFSWVDTVQQLQIMCEKLKKVEEIAIDIEQHGYRSYQGFNCLIQISTRDEDFVVDTIVLRSSLSLLNETFTNPNIVKVLHGSDNDIVWLQRDFGVYIVNLFDTGQAARQLLYPKFSLSFLLEKFCNVTGDKKKFQLADWRIRPLPQDMLEYARSDTHYLLYIYDRMHNELLERGNVNNSLLKSTLNNSRELCKRVYIKDMFQPTLDSIQIKCTGFNAQQNSVLAALFEWRDFFARQEDESIRYILPNHMLIRIAELMPQDPIELFSCCNPQPPPFIKSNSGDVIQIIKMAKENKTQNLTGLPKPVQNVNSHTSSKSTVPSILSDTNLSQEQLFEQADWFKSHEKKTAVLHPCNETDVTVPTPSARFFSPSKPQVPNAKVQQLSTSLQSEFCFGASLPSVPDTMEEIYKFSNANRKRNKEKKRLKEDSINAGPVSPIKFGDEPSPKKPENSQEFMKKIGWLQEETTPLVTSSLKKHQRKESTSKPSNNASQDNYQKLQGYDYSKHKSSNFGLHKEQKPKGKQKNDEDLQSISVPNFGRSSHRVRSSKSSQRGKSYSGRGGPTSKRGRKCK